MIYIHLSLIVNEDLIWNIVYCEWNKHDSIQKYLNIKYSDWV